MNMEDLIKFIVVLFIMVGFFIFIFMLMRKDEKKFFSGYKKTSENPYTGICCHKALIEKEVFFRFHTNQIFVFLFDDSFVFFREGFCKKYYILKFGHQNLISLSYKKIGKSKTKLTIFHSEKGIKTPYEVMIISRLKDYEFSLLDNLCESING